MSIVSVGYAIRQVSHLDAPQKGIERQPRNEILLISFTLTSGDPIHHISDHISKFSSNLIQSDGCIIFRFMEQTSTSICMSNDLGEKSPGVTALEGHYSAEPNSFGSMYFHMQNSHMEL